MTASQNRDLVVPAELGGERADRIVAVLTGMSRSRARLAIERGDVTIAGTPVRPADRVPGDVTLSVSTAPEPPPVRADADVVFSVAYEDDAIVVVDKPAGLVVHPGAGTAGSTLADGLLAAYPGLGDLGEAHRWGLVHRIDRDTSGLLLVARTAPVHEALQDALRRREIGRRYLTLVAGSFDNATGTIEAPIGRDPAHPTRLKVVEGGRPSRTHYRRLASWDGAAVTLLGVRLETGRTHQIRVHMQAIDHPVVGDPVYGARRGGPGDPGRTWLHAGELTFDHPVDGATVTVRSALPADLAASLRALGAPDRGAIPGRITESPGAEESGTG